MTTWKSGPLDGRGVPFDVRIVMGPGLVRGGRILADSRGLLSAAFRSDEPHYLAVGSRVAIGPDESSRPVVVVRRSERKDDRVYDFRDEPGEPDARHEPAPRRGAPFVRELDLAFGALALPVSSLWIDAPHIGVSVSLADEQLLAAADLVELRVPIRDGHPPARIWGWIRERRLVAQRVAYSLEGARALSEHFDAEWRRIAGTPERERGES